MTIEIAVPAKKMDTIQKSENQNECERGEQAEKKNERRRAKWIHFEPQAYLYTILSNIHLHAHIEETLQ